MKTYQKKLIFLVICLLLLSPLYSCEKIEDSEKVKEQELELRYENVNSEKDRLIQAYKPFLLPTNPDGKVLFSYLLQENIENKGPILFVGTLTDIWKKNNSVFVAFKSVLINYYDYKLEDLYEEYFYDSDIFILACKISDVNSILINPPEGFLGFFDNPNNYFVVATVDNLEKGFFTVRASPDSAGAYLELDESDIYIAHGKLVEMVSIGNLLSTEK